jgi:hypothetical protein
MAKRKAFPELDLLLLLLLLLIPSLRFARAQSSKTSEAPKTFDLAAIDAYVADHVRDQRETRGHPTLRPNTGDCAGAPP